ncbi:hypothetical protein B0H19DRAFT_1024554 [Mycena capillaripes]|nr:hypothetical protein B0H19DRAFT_1024554 [Mycena capillaripes]
MRFFQTPAAASPFSSYSPSTSALLLVCKAWLRVSTPLLYNVVIIRSKAQSEALEAALNSNNGLGAFIKKLRIEGGFGLTMKTILEASPNITNLVLFLAIWSSDEVSGLCQGLHLIDPFRLVLHDIRKLKDNNQNKKLVKKVAECIQLWKRLNTVDIPYSFDWTWQGSSRCDEIGKALKTAPSLEQVIIPIPTFETPSFLSQILENVSLKRVKIKYPVPFGRVGPFVLTLLDTYPNLKEVLRFSTADITKISPPSNPSFVPMQSAPQEVQNKIWTRILYFTLSMDGFLASDIQIPSYSNVAQASNRLARNTMLVSKQFKRLSTPFFYANIVLEGEGHLPRFAATLRGDPTIAKHVRSLSMTEYAVRPRGQDIPNDPDWYWECEDAPSYAEEQLLSILPMLNGLVSFTGWLCDAELYLPHLHIFSDILKVPWTTFPALGAAVGANLRRLCIDVIPPLEIQSPLVLESFLSLRSLDWKCPVKFDSGLVLVPETFANLECLFLLEYHPSFLDVLGSIELPSLRRVFFHRNIASTAECFFKRHGSKLTQIMLAADDYGEFNVLNACPRLPLLICTGEKSIHGNANILPSIDLFCPSKPHLHLTKVVLNILVNGRKEAKKMTAFFNALDTTLLPALREIQVSEIHWPRTEREIVRSPWVRWAEEILIGKNIKLTDMNAKHWTPRLKSGRQLIG